MDTLRRVVVAAAAGAGVGSLATVTVAKVVRDHIRDREAAAYHDGWRRGLTERPRTTTRRRAA